MYYLFWRKAGHVACMGGGQGQVHTVFRWGDMRERDHLEDPGIEGMVLQEVGLGEMDWIDLA